MMLILSDNVQSLLLSIDINQVFKKIVISNRFTKKKIFLKILVCDLLVMRWYDIQRIELIMEKKFYQNRFLTYSLHQEFVLSCSFFALAYFFLHFVLLSIDKHFEVSLEHGV